MLHAFVCSLSLSVTVKDKKLKTTLAEKREESQNIYKKKSSTGLMVAPRLSGIITHGLFAMFLLCPRCCSPSGLETSNGINIEVQVLLSIKAMLNDPNGALLSWDKLSVDPCTWSLVTCSSENFVISLDGPSQNFSGTLSASIGNLTNLVTVLLQGNNISGTIPPEIGKLSSLETLDLSNNHFYGGIPASFSHLQSLQYLKLSNNSISGAFPVTAWNHSQLVFLDLSYNNLSGPLPPRGFGRTYNIVGNPLICGAGQQKDCFGIQSMANLTDTQSVPLSGKVIRNNKVAVAFGSSIGCIIFLFLTVG